MKNYRYYVLVLYKTKNNVYCQSIRFFRNLHSSVIYYKNNVDLGYFCKLGGVYFD